MKQRFSAERKGRPECHPVQSIANMGFRRLRIGFLLVGALVALEAGAQTPETPVQKGAITPVPNGVEPPPTFSKSFAPDTIGPGGVSTLTFTIDNIASALAAASLAFTDTLPAGMTIASPSNATTTCTGGTLTAVSGAGVITYSGGSVSAGASCTVQVDVTTSSFGVLVNTSGDLTSSFGNSGPATGTLTVVIVPPTFSKSFVPSTIGPGSVSTLTFIITNNDPTTPLSDLAFTDILPTVPGDVDIATPANASTTCLDGVVTAPAGGGTIAFSDGKLGVGETCTVTVDVTAGTAGTHMNVSGALTYAELAGAPPTASADLTVDITRPGFSKSFAPSSVPLGGRSTLTFTIDNSANASFVILVGFTDNLPVGMEIASPANASTDCVGALLTAVPGTSVIALSGGLMLAGTSCTVSVDVVATGGGMLDNISSDLIVSGGESGLPSGKASATLDVTFDTLHLTKSFTDDPVPPGGTATLQFTIDNFDRSDSATGIDFTDDLALILPGTPDITALGLPLTGLCPAGDGTLTGSAGATFLTFSGATVAAESSCTFTVDLAVPVGAPIGIHTNTTSDITGDIGGSMETGSAASDDLFVQPIPLLTKEFTDDPVGGGDTVTLSFTITNTSLTSTATDIAFEDEFDVILPTASSPGAIPPAGFCSGATATFTPLIDPLPPGGVTPATLVVSGGSLAASTSCTFSIILDVLVGAPTGTYPNATSTITAMVDGVTYTGDPATDDLEVVAPPMLMKEFTDDPVVPGGTVTLEFTLTHDALAPGDATGITFTDDLAAAISGLAASAGELPLTGLCPAGDGTLTGSSGDTLLTFSGATLMPGDVCTFSVTLDVPGAATGGPHTNTTSSVVATVLGVSTTENPASDDLEITSVSLTKSFTDDPVIAGGTVTLEFTLENTHPTDDATSIFFTDNLGLSGFGMSPALPGLASTSGTLTDICGSGSEITGTTVLTFTGGNLMAGDPPCTFSVTLDVPPAAASGTYINATTLNSALLGGTLVFPDPATDGLIVSSDLLSLTKSFTNDPVAPGGTVTLEFMIANLDSSNTVTGITFTDDLETTLTGLAPAAGGLPMDGFCGPGSTLTFMTGVLTLAGGTLASSAMCTFTVTLDVPMGATGPATNTTSTISGLVGVLPVAGDAASDDLLIENLTFSKMFSVPVPPGGTAQAGGTVTLTFTITNLDASVGVSGLEFFDDLTATLAGLTVTGLPSDPCGATGSSIVESSPSELSFSGGNLLPSGSCTFEVDLLLPLTPLAGTFPNTTTDLTISGLPVASAAADDLVIATDIPNTVSANASNADPVMVTITTTVTAP